MKITKIAVAGSLTSSDVLVTIGPAKTLNKISITITSPVLAQFGSQLQKVALATLKKLKIASCDLVIQDQGAIDQVLVARITTAYHRSINQAKSVIKED